MEIEKVMSLKSADLLKVILKKESDAQYILRNKQFLQKKAGWRQVYINLSKSKEQRGRDADKRRLMRSKNIERHSSPRHKDIDIREVQPFTPMPFQQFYSSDPHQRFLSPDPHQRFLSPYLNWMGPQRWP